MGAFTKVFWLVFVGIVGTVCLLFVLVGFGVFGRLPSFDELENPKSVLASEVITTDGVMIGKYFTENRTNCTFANLPACLQNALLATEDVRFYDHTGVDLKAIGRAIFGVALHDSKGGGSTITQQLAKNLFPRAKLNKLQLVFRKLQEWIIAVKLERAYTKPEIMAMYLNTVEFSDNAFGVQTAAYTYFGKTVDSLKTEEAAMLVGMLKAPYQYNPRIHPETALKRRNVVLNQLYQYNFLTLEQRDSMFALPIALNFHADTHEDGLAPYFRETLRLYMKDWCAQHKKPNGKPYDLYKDGLKIYVTLDSRVQRYAEEAQREHLAEWQQFFFKHWEGKDPWKGFPDEWKAIYNACGRVQELRKAGKSEAEIEQVMQHPVKMKMFTFNGERDTVMSPFDSIRYHRLILQNGLMAMDPQTGFVRAWVGGVNYKYFQFDHVNKNTKRQIGSTFKPFIYTVAIRDKGYSPCFKVPNQLVTFEKDDPRFHLIKDWSPHNADGKYGEPVTLKYALANSINTVSAYLMHEIGPESVIALVKKMGITAEIPNQPSICLGTADISLFEMVGAYTAFANKGIHTEPIFITRIEDKSGSVVQNFVAQQQEVLDEQTTYTMVELMRGVVQYGTSVRLRYRYKLMSDLIGKTGTTSSYSDGWFIGASPDLVTGCWVGCDDRYIHFNSLNFGQGASTALPIFAKFYQKLYADTLLQELDATHKFEPPAGKLNSEFDCKQFEEHHNEGVKEYGDE